MWQFLLLNLHIYFKSFLTFNLYSNCFMLQINRSMQSWEKNISIQLNKNTKQTIPIRGISNCMIANAKFAKTYSYFEFVQDQGFIQPYLVTLVSNKNDIYRLQVTSGSFFRQRQAGIREVQVTISPHPSQNIYLVLFTYRFRDKSHTTLSLLQLDLESILTSEIAFIQLQEISIKQQVLKANWHPYYHDYFLVLTKKEINVHFIGESNQNDSSFDFPCISYNFRDLQINEPIVDFQFWRGQGNYSRLLTLALTQVGRVVIVLCILQPQPLTEQQYDFLQGINKMFRTQNPHGYLTKWYDLPLTQMKNGRSINLYHSGPANLLVETSDIINSTKTTFLKISALQQFNGQLTQKELICIEDFNPPDYYTYFEMQNQLINNSLYFLYKNKLIKIDLEKQLKYMQPTNKRKSYDIPALKIDTVLDFAQSHPIFLQFQTHYLRLLRKSDKVSELNSFPLLSIELSCSTKDVDQKLNTLFNSINQRILEVQKDYLPRRQTQIVIPFQDYKADSEKSILTANENTQTHISHAQSQIKQSIEDLFRLFQDVKEEARNFNSKNKRRQELQTLLKSINQNSQCIDRQINERGSKEGQDTIDYLYNMINFVNSKKVDLEPEQEQQFMEMTNQHLKNLQKIIIKLEQTQEKLNNI